MLGRMVDSRSNELGLSIRAREAAHAIVRASSQQWSEDPSLLTVSQGTQAFSVSSLRVEKDRWAVASAHRSLHSTMPSNIRGIIATTAHPGRVRAAAAKDRWPATDAAGLQL